MVSPSGSHPAVCFIYASRRSPSCKIFCGVVVSVVDSTALRASPFPSSKVVCPVPSHSAWWAKLVGREETVYSDNLFSIPHRLVLQLPPDSSQLASEIDLANLWFFTIFLDIISSMQRISFSLTNCVDSLCNISFRWLEICWASPPVPALSHTFASLCFSGELPLKSDQLLLALGEIFLGVDTSRHTKW